MDKYTPLYQWHISNDGRMVSFAGFSMPVQYDKGVIAEHNAVRNSAGLFDISHMGEFFITGKDALKNLNFIFTNDFSKMNTGRVRYTLMCNDSGGIIDDLVICKFDDERYLLVVNAANCEKDAAWIKKQLNGNCGFEDVSGGFSQIALQGPASQSILSLISKTIPEKYYTFIEKGFAAQIPCIVSKTGYTGEDGFELYCKNEDAQALWEKLLEAGRYANIIPCGLGSRDTLRLEAGMPLWGHEMDEDTTPFEAGLSFAVKMEKPDFIGKLALTKPISKKLTGIEITGRGIVREKSDVFHNGKRIGYTTSGTFCPYLEKSCAMAYLEPAYGNPGIIVEAQVRGKMIEGKTCVLPFYRRKKTEDL